MLPIFCNLLRNDTAMARTTTSISVAYTISLVNPWWNAWEARKRSHVSASPWVQDKSERSGEDDETMLSPFAEITCFSRGGFILLCSIGKKLEQALFVCITLNEVIPQSGGNCIVGHSDIATSSMVLLCLWPNPPAPGVFIAGDLCVWGFSKN